MRIRYGAYTTAGPVRANNEDSIGVLLPEDHEAGKARGALVVLADGVGGFDAGEIASRMAVNTCLQEFVDAPVGATPNQVIWRIFNAANLGVFDHVMRAPSRGRMATTLTAAIFRYNEIAVGHVGDCRAYLFRENRIRRITNDHSYAGVQLKLGLVTVEEAAASPNRSILTRTVGQDAMVRIDYHRVQAFAGDRYLQCCDGVHAFLTEGEIFRIVMEKEPQAAAEALVAAALKRGGDDNLTAQVVYVEDVEARAVNGSPAPTQKKAAGRKMGTELQVGEVLDDRFETTDLISRSGMAQIFKAQDRETGLTVVLKVPLMQFESDPGFYSRFEREEQIGLKLQNPYIIRIEQVTAPKSRPYIVMEYLEGQTLAHLMQSVRPMPEGDAVRIASRLCEALHYMHGHDIVHRDLKPDNIMICNDGSLRIMDFGIAKFEGMRRLTFGGFTPAMGTPDYMAPEQVKGKRGDKRTDIYALGAILYEMVTGATPFEGSNPFLIMNARLTGDPIAPREINPAVSPQVEEIILHAMSRDPADRYPDAKDMREDLDHLPNVKLTGRATRLTKPQAWKARWSRTRLYLIAVGIPVIVVVVAWLATHLRWK